MEWSVLDMVQRHWGDNPNAVGWWSWRLADAEADYYLVDGTPLQSWWRPRGDGMHNISIDTGRPVGEEERGRVIVRRPMDSDRLLRTQSGDRFALQFSVRYDKPQGIIMWLNESLKMGSWTLDNAEIVHEDDYTQMTWLLPPGSVDGSHLLWFTEN